MADPGYFFNPSSWPELFGAPPKLAGSAQSTEQQSDTPAPAEQPPPAGLMDQLKAAIQAAADRKYQEVLAQNEAFKANPVGHILRDVMFGLQTIGGPRAPMMRLPPTGAPPPPGAYLQPKSGPALFPADKPVDALSNYAQTASLMDPKMIARQYTSMWGDNAIPKLLEAKNRMGPADGGAAGILEEAAAYLQRNQSYIDSLQNVQQ